MCGRLDEARPIIERAIQVSLATGDASGESLTRFVVSWFSIWQGEYEDAVDSSSVALQIARDHKLLTLLMRCLWTNSVALIGRGDYDRAQELLSEGFELADKVGDESMAPRMLNTLGWLCLECGDLERGMEIAATTTSRKYIAIGHRIGAEIALGRLDLDEAHAQAQRVVALAQQIRNPTQLWRTHGLLGDILERMSRPDEARAAFAASAAVIQRITSGLEDPQLRHSLERASAVRAILERHVAS